MSFSGAARRLGIRSRNAWRDDGDPKWSESERPDASLVHCRAIMAWRKSDRADGHTNNDGQHEANILSYARHYVECGERTQERRDGISRDEAVAKGRGVDDTEPGADDTEMSPEGRLRKRATEAYKADAKVPSNKVRNRIQAARVGK